MDDKDIIKTLTEVEQRARSNTRRIDRLEARQDDLEKLTETVATMQAELKSVVTLVGETKQAVKELQAKPGRWWDRLLTALLTALAGYLLGLVTRGGV